jgi:hypothetical protein
MKKLWMILSLGFFFSNNVIAGGNSAGHIYIVYYATSKGKTGHIGLAIDKYKIIFTEQAGRQIADTISTGELFYYDLWPNDDFFNIMRTGKDIPAVYFKLPVSSTEEITVNSLFDTGIPHRENYPCDGLLKLSTTWEQNNWLTGFLDSMVSANRDFNGRKFNCVDFVKIPVEKILNTRLRCREFIGLGWSTTPNRLYKKLRKSGAVVVVKNADKKARGSFLGQRVFYPIFHRTKN